MRKLWVVLMASVFGLVSLGLSEASALGAQKGKGRGRDRERERIFQGRGQSGMHSNAPLTGTQVRGKERALEVGKGKKKGLHRDGATDPASKVRENEKKSSKGKAKGKKG